MCLVVGSSQNAEVGSHCGSSGCPQNMVAAPDRPVVQEMVPCTWLLVLECRCSLGCCPCECIQVFMPSGWPILMPRAQPGDSQTDPLFRGSVNSVEVCSPLHALLSLDYDNMTGAARAYGTSIPWRPERSQAISRSSPNHRRTMNSSARMSAQSTARIASGGLVSHSRSKASSVNIRTIILKLPRRRQINLICV
jgi:hypothetical protein